MGDSMTGKLNEVLTEARGNASSLLAERCSDPQGFPTTSGVYFIYNAEGKIFYVGQANNLRQRVRNHTSGGGKNCERSVFCRKISRGEYNGEKINCGEEMRNWVKNNCQFSCIKIHNKDSYGLVETFLIKLLRIQGFKLLNS